MKIPYLPFCIVILAGSLLNAQRAYVPQYNKPLDPGLVTGASINEAEATLTVYVNSGHPAAADTNAGLDRELPLLTIDRGIDVALEQMEAADTGVRVWIANGTYATREYNFTEFRTDQVRRGLTTRQEEHVLIIEGETRGGVIIDGTEKIPQESIEDLGDGLYGFSWTRNWGYSRELMRRSPGDETDPAVYGGELAHRLETLWINGQRLDPVILEPHDLQPTTFAKWVRIPDAYLGREAISEPGTFGVSELEEDMIFFRLPDGVDLSSADIRIGVGMSFLEIQGKSNIVIRNLVMRGLTQPWSNPRGAITLLGFGELNRISNVLIEDVEIYDQSTSEAIWVALADNVTLRRIIVRGGGGNGISGGGNVNVIFEDLDFSENNWRTLMGGMERWIVAGLKFLVVEDLLVDRFVAYGNQASGFWLDTEIENAVVNELYAVDNYMFGFYNEKNYGEVFAENGVWMNNRRYGLHQAETGNTILRNNIAIGNGESPIGFRVRDFWTTDPSVTDQKITQDIVLEGNMLISTGFQPIFAYEGAARSFYTDSFIPTFSGSDNLYWSPSFNPNVFLTTRNTDFAGWLEDIPDGEDAGSVFEDPGIDPNGDGLAHFFLFENTGAESLDAFGTVEAVNAFQWDMDHARPVMDMPYGWRSDAAIEAHFLLQAVDSGTYTLVLNSNFDSAVYLSSDETLSGVPPNALVLSGAATAFRDWEDAGNGTAEIQLEAGRFYHVVVRGAVPAMTELPFLSLGWNAPWMEPGEIRPLAAPYIRSANQLPMADTGVLASAVRHANDTRYLDGFGYFWNLGDGWRYHHVHRALYVPDDQTLPDIWGFSQALGWTYFNPSIGERWLYSNAFASWIYSQGWTDGDPWYYVYSGPNQGWIQFP
jgi:hypothetical protein